VTPELTSIAARIRDFISRTSGAGVSPVSFDSGSSRGEEAHSETDLEGSLLTSAATDQEFNSLALALFAAQFAHNAAYRKLCQARGATPGSVERWSRIPAVPASAFKELELTCLTAAERTTVFHSSGTTEQRPSRHFHNSESLDLYEASLWPWFYRHVLVDLTTGGWKLAILTPPPSATPNSSLVHMFETIRRKTGAGEAAFLGGVGPGGAWTLDSSRAAIAVHTAIDIGQPLVLLGTAFNFVHLLDEFAARSLEAKLPPGSVVMETGGYKGRSRELPKAELHALITRMLGVLPSQIICEYGMSELSSQAYVAVAGDDWRVAGDTKPSLHASRITRHFHFAPWARVQIISPETGREAVEGETGLVRVFDLANAFSALAVQTEDLAIRRGGGFELVGRAAAAEPRGCSLMTSLGVPPLGGLGQEPPKGGTPNPAARKT